MAGCVVILSHLALLAVRYISSVYCHIYPKQAVILSQVPLYIPANPFLLCTVVIVLTSTQNEYICNNNNNNNNNTMLVYATCLQFTDRRK